MTPQQLEDLVKGIANEERVSRLKTKLGEEAVAALIQEPEALENALCRFIEPWEHLQIKALARRIYASRIVAWYVLENGGRPFQQRPEFYVVKKTLADGRLLEVGCSEIGPECLAKPSPKTRLEIDLKPVRADQIGYFTVEHGLQGEVEFFRIYDGSIEPYAPSLAFFHAEDKQNDWRLPHARHVYTLLLENIYKWLSQDTQVAATKRA